MVRTLTLEIAPIRVNAIHPGPVGDSPAWVGNAAAIDRARSQSPGGRIPTTSDCVAATLLLLDTASMNGANLVIDAG
jgi:NAD(P)-dependent dehydrogenase (short-subunit alcohol dehydrogenase family)